MGKAQLPAGHEPVPAARKRRKMPLDISPQSIEPKTLVRPKNVLDAHGRDFMKMFDDYQEEREESTLIANESMDASSSSSSADESDEGGQAGASMHSDLAKIFDGDKAASAASAKTGGAHTRGSGRNLVTFVDPSGPGKPLPSRKQLALERRRFMSCKVGKIHTEVQEAAPASIKGDVDFLSPEAFNQIRQEAQELGAAALDKKARKAFEEKKLSQIGAKGEKAPRTAAMIGKGMAKKQQQRAHKALEEAISTGMVQKKGLGKKRRMAQTREHSKTRSGENDGLGGRFKDGILHVSKPVVRKDWKKRKGSLLKGIKL